MVGAFLQGSHRLNTNQIKKILSSQFLLWGSRPGLVPHIPPKQAYEKDLFTVKISVRF